MDKISEEAAERCGVGEGSGAKVKEKEQIVGKEEGESSGTEPCFVCQDGWAIRAEDLDLLPLPSQARQRGTQHWGAEAGSAED